MLSIKSASAVALLFASSVTAQFNYTVDPATVLPDIRANWCAGQQNTCGTLCDANTSENECSPATFNYTCLCAANNSAPGLQYYTISMPSYLCEQQFSICNELEVSAAGKAKCLATKKATCGTLDPNSYQPAAASESATTSGSSSTAAPTASGTGAPAAAPTTSTSAGLAPTTVATLGKGAFAVGIAAFGLLI